MTAQYCAGFFFSGSGLSELRNLSFQILVRYGSTPTFLQSPNPLTATQNGLCAVGVVTAR